MLGSHINSKANIFLVLAVGILAIFSELVIANDSIVLRVASYNVKYGNQATPEQIGNMLKHYDLDIIGFNEAPKGNWTSRVGKLLGMNYSQTGKISSANHKDKYKSILSRNPIQHFEEYKLPVGKGWNPASAVKAIILFDNKPITFYSLHISASGKKDGHAYLLASKVLPRDDGERIIMTGDFNNRIDDPAMRTILKKGMSDIWKDLNIDLSEHTTVANEKPSKHGIIDHILYNTSSSAEAIAGGIIELEKPLSDHKPVWAEIVFPK